MKRQVSIQNFFVEKQNVTNNEIEISNRNVSSAIVDIVNIVNTDNSVIYIHQAISFEKLEYDLDLIFLEIYIHAVVSKHCQKMKVVLH